MRGVKHIKHAAPSATVCSGNKALLLVLGHLRARGVQK